MAGRKLALGLDFGTESARALLVDLETGAEVGTAVAEYAHGVIDRQLPSTGQPLEPDWALQDPQDYLECLRAIVPAALREAGAEPGDVVGIGVDFTSCTVVATDAAGTPLCTKQEWRDHPHAWVKLWKHHAAQPEADEMNRLAEERGETFLRRFGGKLSSEWLFPKVLQVIHEDPAVFEAAERFIEGGDWLVWQLTGTEARSACQAGYKATWSREEGYPSQDYLRALDPRLAEAVGTRIGTEILPMGARAGVLTERAADLTGLKAGTPVAVAVIDAHVAVPAATVVRPGQLLMIMGTSLCHMTVGAEFRAVEGIAGIVSDGILPGFYGYEAGQAAVGDIFGWFVKNCVPEEIEVAARESGRTVHEVLEERASRLRPGESGLLALDWWNGNRSVLADANLTGLLLGYTLETKPEEIYRALIEATAFGTRMILENFESQGVEVSELYACGGLAERNDLLMRIYADVTGRRISVAGSPQTCALGAAMWGSVAAGSAGGGYDTIQEAAQRMAGLREDPYSPNPEHRETYDLLYEEYRRLHDYFGRGGNDVMRRLKALRTRSEP